MVRSWKGALDDHIISFQFLYRLPYTSIIIVEVDYHWACVGFLPIFWAVEWVVSRFRWRLQGRSTGRVGKVGWPVVVALLRLHLALRSAAPKAAHRNRNERRRRLRQDEEEPGHHHHGIRHVAYGIASCNDVASSQMLENKPILSKHINDVSGIEHTVMDERQHWHQVSWSPGTCVLKNFPSSIYLHCHPRHHDWRKRCQLCRRKWLWRRSWLGTYNSHASSRCTYIYLLCLGIHLVFR